jgi:hypothetical protein
MGKIWIWDKHPGFATMPLLSDKMALAGKLALVTGGGSGIGRSVCQVQQSLLVYHRYGARKHCLTRLRVHFGLLI